MENLLKNGYREHPYIANSDLKRKAAEKGFISSFVPKNIQEIFEFGQGLHTHCQSIALNSNYVVTDPVYKEMVNSFMSNQLINSIVSSKDIAIERDFYRKDCEFFNIFSEKFEDISIKCSWDFYLEKSMFGAVGIELKSTSAKTQKEFETQCKTLYYDAALSHYQLASNCDTMIIAGVSKHNYKLFITVIDSPNSALMQRGIELRNKFYSIYNHY